MIGVYFVKTAGECETEIGGTGGDADWAFYRTTSRRRRSRPMPMNAWESQEGQERRGKGRGGKGGGMGQR